MIDLRPAREEDHPEIVAAIQRWWSDSRSPEAARELSLLVPRLFLQHFAGTSLVAEQDGRMAGFLIGFGSADRAADAYIHFVGVDPELRRSGFARRLYGEFFAAAARAGRTRVHCVTSPANTGSIAFHRSMGFELTGGDAEIGGIPVHRDYDGAGHDRVCFVREIEPAEFR
ncbi:Predicted acetyltransferase, GNAT superfamily [Saccharopolyspora antimicrobica]|uniref:GNAT superfamily acetyltransferase n=1 Tax=Saccharopolyspora antimicrobica TaxID=455193 RepID=A0A1I5JGF3_9PSEU|nr:GNAT family N-acetyltransferase [Saccharopolyspora antimicrobica]RKT82534.1 putative GNAT superfamily acetyltransferase [Saccharopolyspora antimicrobica]SFO71908.1 Predicted acetyltransferase, GNAT superfamily [Saccharopolyspora antimicrobica]